MKKYIYIILTVALCLVSCSDDKEDNWTADVLNVSCDELMSAGDGNFKVALPTEYAKAINLKLQTNSGWEISVDNMTGEEVKWITPSPATGSGNADVQLLIAGNETNIDRKCSVVITTKGDIPVKKTITVIQGNTDDMLTLDIDEMSLPEGVKVNEVGGGSWNMVLPKDFKGDLSGFVIEGTASYTMSITYIEGGDGWVTEKVEEQNLLGSAKTLTLNVKENVENVYREALVMFSAIAGDITVTKSISISQVGAEKVIWKGEYFQGSLDELDKAEIILPATKLERIEIAEIENISDSDIELPISLDWLTLVVEDGKLFVSTTENTSTNRENLGSVVIKSKKSTDSFSMRIRQCMQDYGVILNKSYWDIKLGIDNVISAGTKPGGLTGLYDNVWSTDKSNMSYAEFSNTVENKVIFIVDLGENSCSYNNVGLMPRLEWVAQCPARLKVEYSNDNSTWIEAYDGECFTRDELMESGRWKTNCYEGIVKWFEVVSDAKTINHRYLRLTVSESLYSSKAPYYFSFDEIFISRK